MKKTLTILAAMIVLMAVGTVQADYSVDYTAELKEDGSCIKFEDAMYLVDEVEDIWEDAGLGDDGVVETDTFVVTVDGPVAEIGVALKAGKCRDNGTIDLGDPQPLDLCGFTVELVEVIDDVTYVLAVTSDDIVGGKGGTAALSNITFCFGDDATVVDPEEGAVTIDRLSPYEEPTEPEEIDED